MARLHQSSRFVTEYNIKSTHVEYCFRPLESIRMIYEVLARPSLSTYIIPMCGAVSSSDIAFQVIRTRESAKFLYFILLITASLHS